MTGKLNKKMFEPFEGSVSIQKGDGRRVSYLSVKRYADTLKELALKRRTSIAAVLGDACRPIAVAKRPAARLDRKGSKA